MKTSNDMGRSHIDVYLTPLLLARRLKPLRAKQRDQQIRKEKGGHNGGQVNHSNTSDVVATDEKRVTQAHRKQTKQEHCWKPNLQIHQCVSLEPL